MSRDGAVRVWIDFLQELDAIAASKEAGYLWNCLGGSRDYAKSSWISADSDPRCSLERLALNCLKFHGGHFSGAEFWVQYREGSTSDSGTSNGLEFHFDKDEQAVLESDTWLHPEVSTVTYLCGGDDRHRNNSFPNGAPLVIFETHSEEDSKSGQVSGAYSPARSWTIFPLPRAHVAFAGTLLHGVPAELNPLIYPKSSKQGNCSYRRLSVAVNLWKDHKPKGSEPLPQSLIEELKRISGFDAKVPAQAIDPISWPPSSLIDIEARISTTKSAALNDAKSPERRIEITTRATSPVGPDVVESNWYQLREHRKGDTAPLPIGIVSACLRKLIVNRDQSNKSDEKLKQNYEAGVCVRYAKRFADFSEGSRYFGHNIQIYSV